MFGSKARGTLMVLVISWLALFIDLSHAAGNKLAHAYKRLWLWNYYQLAIEIQGAEKQQDIFPFIESPGDDKSNNRGSGPHNSLTYSEFMWRLSNNKKEMPSLKLKEPTSVDAIDDAVKELRNRGLTSRVSPEEIDPSLHKSRHVGQQGDELHRGNYALLFDKLQLQLTDWRINQKHDVIDPRMDNFKKINNAVLILRREDVQSAVFNSFVMPRHKRGLGLKTGQVVVQKKSSELEIGPSYKKVLVEETWSQNNDRLKKRFGSEEKLHEWVTNFGISGVEGHNYKFEDYSHFRLIKSWEKIKKETDKSASELAKCKNS